MDVYHTKQVCKLFDDCKFNVQLLRQDYYRWERSVIVSEPLLYMDNYNLHFVFVNTYAIFILKWI